jgi:hypothetical protein
MAETSWPALASLESSVTVEAEQKTFAVDVLSESRNP